MCVVKRRSYGLIANTQIETFPHHKHTPEVEKSEEIGLERVLDAIRMRLI
jgi:hypothetical protein